MRRWSSINCWVCALFIGTSLPSRAEDFIYVLATPPGERSEILWIPAGNPQSARVLVENLHFPALMHQHRDELWWRANPGITHGNLVGQEATLVESLNTSGFSDMVRQGDWVYVISSHRELTRQNLITGERQVLVKDHRFGAELAIHEDRLYFMANNVLESCRIDGNDRRLEIPSNWGQGQWPIQALEVHKGVLIWSGRQLWSKDLRTEEVAALGPRFPELIDGLAVTDEAVYWTSVRTVWRWKRGSEEHERLFELGGIRMRAIAAVSAAPYPVNIPDKEELVTMSDSEGTYQLLLSLDLRSWSPDYVERSLFTPVGTLQWLKPQSVKFGDSIVWRPELDVGSAYFSAWKYDLESPFDADGDELPDYWERRYFGDLSPIGTLDTDDDGLTHLDEARVFTNPNSKDSDGDGLSDREETTSSISSDPALADTDADGLRDDEEIRDYKTNPRKPDSDLDRFDDAFEVLYGSDPNDREESPTAERVLADFAGDLLVQFEFDSIDNGLVANTGLLGGVGRIVGNGTLLDPEETRTGTGALAFREESELVSYVETDLQLGDLGLAREDAEFTISLWTKAFEPSASALLTTVSPTGGMHDVLGIETDPTDRFVRAYRGRQSSRYSIVELLESWKHLTWTVASDGWKVYVNGNLVVDNENAFRALLESEATLRLGARLGDDESAASFKGAYDDFRIYRKALPAGAVKLLVR